MRSHFIRRFSQFSWIAVLSLSLTLAVTGQSASSASMASGNEGKSTAKETDEVEGALPHAGQAPPAKRKTPLFPHSISFFTADFPAKAVAAPPASLHKRRITQSKLLSRVETIFRQTLESHGRSGKLD